MDSICCSSDIFFEGEGAVPNVGMNKKKLNLPVRDSQFVASKTPVIHRLVNNFQKADWKEILL